MRVELSTKIGTVYAILQTKTKLSRSYQLTIRGECQNGFGQYVAFLYHPEIIKVSHPDTPDYAVEMRNHFSENVIQQFNNEEASNLALSYLTGQKNLLSQTQKDKLRLVGLAHVVVASGYHLSVVVNLAKKRFGRISRFATMGGALLLLVIYISVTGFTPSMIRAGMMAALSLWAWYFGRRFHPARLILYVAALSLILDMGLVSNLAWQLSFLSYMGIIFLSPLISKFLYGDKKPSYFASLIIVSFSAQLFCLPLTICQFGSISILALLSNLLITPSIPFAMLATFLTGLTNLPLFAFVAKTIIGFHLYIIDYIANIPWAAFDVGKNSAFLLIYIPIILMTFALKRLTKHSYRPSYVLAESPNYGKI